MSYSEDNVSAKLSALNESSESIVTTGQWVMFHRRHADKTMKIWADKVKDASAAKKLNLVYLINEIAQQCKLRKREEFRTAMSAHIAEGVQSAYKGSTNDIKQKLKRVVEVWKDRAVFEDNILEDIDRKLADIDRQVGTVKRSLFGGPSAANQAAAASIPVELTELAKLTTRVEKASIAIRDSQDATKDWEKSMNSIDMRNANPMNAALINGIYDRLVKAHAAALESVASRKAMIEELEKLLNAQKDLYANHQALVESYADKKEQTFHKKNRVHNALLANMHYDTGDEPPRPEVEALTPPPMEDDYEPPEPEADGSGTPPAMFGFEEAEDEDDGHQSKKRKYGNGYSAFSEDVDELIASEGRG